MQVKSSISNGTATLTLAGRFDFNTHRDFKDGVSKLISDSINNKIKQLVIDLSGVEYLDSSALGMLLLAKESSAKANIEVSLQGAKNTVKQILEIANFGKLFKII